MDDFGDESNVDLDKVEACTTSTNTEDDNSYRREHLMTVPFYAYRMYVRRVPCPRGRCALSRTRFAFGPPLIFGEPPRAKGFLASHQHYQYRRFPVPDQDAQTCGRAQNFKHMLSNTTAPVAIFQVTCRSRDRCLFFNQEARSRSTTIIILVIMIMISSSIINVQLWPFWLKSLLDVSSTDQVVPKWLRCVLFESHLIAIQ